jgi:hypothetical protein
MLASTLAFIIGKGSSLPMTLNGSPKGPMADLTSSLAVESGLHP